LAFYFHIYDIQYEICFLGNRFR